MSAHDPTWTSQPSVNPRFTIRHFAEIDSTNTYLAGEAVNGAPDGLVAVTDFQSSGRGRFDREWIAPLGSSLLVSVLIRQPDLPLELHNVAAGAALRAALEQSGVQADMKWPNDLVVGNRKLAGVLSETVGGGNNRAVVIGTGCNLVWKNVPSEISEVAVTCAELVGDPPDQFRLLDVYLENLDQYLRDPASALRDYKAHLTTLGQRVKVDLFSSSIVGMAEDLLNNCALAVRTDDDKLHEITAGDVTHLRVAE